MIVSGILNSGCERSGGLVRKIGQKRLNCRPAIFTKKSQKIRETYGFTDFSGGPNRDRTDDLTDAKRHLNLFCIIFNYLWCFPLSFSFFPSLFGTLISMCYTAVCGGSCGQKHSLPFAGAFRRRGRGAFFMPLTACIVTLTAGLGKYFLRRPYRRNWGAVDKIRAAAVKQDLPAYSGVLAADPAGRTQQRCPHTIL